MTSRRPLVFLSVALFLFWASLYVYVPVLPIYAGNLGASLADIGLIVGAYGLPQLLFRVPIGLWSDRVGRRQPFGVFALALIAVGAAGLAFSPNPVVLAVSRFLTGCGASYWVIIAVHYAAMYPPSQAVKALGQANAINSFAQFAGNLGGGVIAGLFDLQAVFLAGAGLGALGVAAYAGASDPPQSGASTSFQGGGLPRADLTRYSLIMALAVGVAMATTFGFLSVLAKEIGMPTPLLGTLAAGRVLAIGITSLFVQQAVNRFTLNGSIAIGLTVFGLATLASVVAPEPWTLVALQIVAGLGYGLVAPLTMSGAVNRAASGSRATAMGIYQAVYSIGLTGAPVAAGFIADAFGLRSVFWVCAGLCAVGVLMCWPGRKRA